MSNNHNHSKHSHKSKRGKQMVVSFFLFLMLAVLSLAVCAKAYVVSPNTFSNMFTGNEYVGALHNDIVQYAKDECKKCSIPDGFVEDAITYDAIYNVEASYIVAALGTSQDYSVEAYQTNLDSIQSNLQDALDKELNAQGITNVPKDSIAKYASNVTSYVKDKTQFVYIDKLQTATNIINVVVVAIMVMSAIMIVILVALLAKLHSKRYRLIRSIIYSIEAAGLFDFVMVAFVAALKARTQLGIYPTYLDTAVMDYVGNSMLCVGVSGCVLIFVSVVMMCVVWHKKRHED